MEKKKAAIEVLIQRFRHEGIGEEEVYEELATRLFEDEGLQPMFHELLAVEPLADADAERLRRFYEACMEGVYDLDDDSDRM